MKFRIRSLAILAGFLLSVSGVGFADDASIQAMKDEMKMLNEKLGNVEARLAQVAPAAQGTYVAPVENSGGGLLRSARDIEVKGHVDTQWNHNLTRGGNAIAGGNTGRIFDNDRDSFTLNNAELDFIQAANPEGGAGFRLDVSMGEDSDVVNADGGGTTDKFDLQQAYVEYVQPLGFFEGNEYLPSSINVKAGRFVTLAGSEVIEAQDNWNISRSYAFGLAIPFAHNGVRTNFKLFKDFFDVYFGIVNGLAAPVDFNVGKTFEFGLGYNLGEKVSLFHSIYFGNEGTDTDGSNAGGGRFLNSNVVKFNATDKLAFMGEFNVGNANRAVTAALPRTTPDDVTWFSWNFYGRYALTEKDAFASRFEIYRDGERFTTGLSHFLWDWTLTYERKLADNLLGRAEYRYDHGDNSPYGDSAQMQTITTQLVYII